MDDNIENIELVEIEIYARAGKEVPKNKKYQIRVDKKKFVIENETISGAEIFQLVKKSFELYNLYQHFHKGQTKPIKSDDIVDLTQPGVERFSTMKIENQEGKK